MSSRVLSVVECDIWLFKEDSVAVFASLSLLFFFWSRICRIVDRRRLTSSTMVSYSFSFSPKATDISLSFAFSALLRSFSFSSSTTCFSNNVILSSASIITRESTPTPSASSMLGCWVSPCWTNDIRDKIRSCSSWARDTRSCLSSSIWARNAASFASTCASASSNFSWRAEVARAKDVTFLCSRTTMPNRTLDAAWAAAKVEAPGNRVKTGSSINDLWSMSLFFLLLVGVRGVRRDVNWRMRVSLYWIWILIPSNSSFFCSSLNSSFKVVDNSSSFLPKRSKWSSHSSASLSAVVSFRPTSAIFSSKNSLSESISIGAGFGFLNEPLRFGVGATGPSRARFLFLLAFLPTKTESRPTLANTPRLRVCILFFFSVSLYLFRSLLTFSRRLCAILCAFSASNLFFSDSFFHFAASLLWCKTSFFRRMTSAVWTFLSCDIRRWMSTLWCFMDSISSRRRLMTWSFLEDTVVRLSNSRCFFLKLAICFSFSFSLSLIVVKDWDELVLFSSIAWSSDIIFSLSFSTSDNCDSIRLSFSS